MAEASPFLCFIGFEAIPLLKFGGSSPVSRSGFEQKRTSIQMFFFCSSRAQESPAPAQNFVLAGSENSPPDCFPSRAG